MSGIVLYKMDADGLPVPEAGAVIVFANEAGQFAAKLETGAVVTMADGAGGGTSGPAGPVGPAGPQGPAGADGDDGAPGVAGPQGAAGVAGAVGPAGANGAPGAAGAQGVQGLPGAAGAQGPAGAAGAVGPAGADSTVAGPQGPAGVAGAVGPAGANGAPGAQGAQGLPGAAGAQGPAGVAGVAGAVGPAGAAGAQGIQGIQGVQGPAGAAGSGGAVIFNSLADHTNSTADYEIFSRVFDGSAVPFLVDGDRYELEVNAEADATTVATSLSYAVTVNGARVPRGVAFVLGATSNLKQPVMMQLSLICQAGQLHIVETSRHATGLSGSTQNMRFLMQSVAFNAGASNTVQLFLNLSAANASKLRRKAAYFRKVN